MVSACVQINAFLDGMFKGNEQSESGAAGVQINAFLYKIRTKIEQSENGDAELLNFLKDSI